MNIKTLITLLLLLVVSLSCNRDDSADNSFNYIEIDFFEHFSSSGRELHFNLRTIETFPCSNFLLDVNQNLSGNHLDLRISDIHVPDICITAGGPATQMVSLGQTSNIPSELTVWVNTKQHDFSVVVEKDFITISTGSQFEEHLFFNFDSLKRIPENTIWGFSAFESNNDEKNPEIWSEIEKAFLDAGAKEIILEDGFYFYFSVKDNTISFESVKQIHHTFYYYFEDSLDILVDIYEKTLEKYENATMQLRLFDTRGDRRHII